MTNQINGYTETFTDPQPSITLRHNLNAKHPHITVLSGNYNIIITAVTLNDRNTATIQFKYFDLGTGEWVWADADRLAELYPITITAVEC